MPQPAQGMTLQPHMTTDPASSQTAMETVEEPPWTMRNVAASEVTRAFGNSSVRMVYCSQHKPMILLSASTRPLAKLSVQSKMVS